MKRSVALASRVAPAVLSALLVFAGPVGSAQGREPRAAAGAGAAGEAAGAGEAGPGFRRWRLPAPPTAGAGFRPVDPARSGVRFTHSLAEASAARNRILENGSGVALGDVDGDGRPDMYFCSLEGTNALYLNRGGWRFEETARASGVECGGQASTGCLMLDVDGDRATALGHSCVFRHAGEGFEAWRVSANRWELERRTEGWRVRRRVNRPLDGSEAARALLSLPGATPQTSP